MNDNTLTPKPAASRLGASGQLYELMSQTQI